MARRCSVNSQLSRACFFIQIRNESLIVSQMVDARLGDPLTLSASCINVKREINDIEAILASFGNHEGAREGIAKASIVVPSKNF